MQQIQLPRSSSLYAGTITLNLTVGSSSMDGNKIAFPVTGSTNSFSFLLRMIMGYSFVVAIKITQNWKKCK
jgi:hypothetical protein